MQELAAGTHLQPEPICNYRIMTASLLALLVAASQASYRTSLSLEGGYTISVDSSKDLTIRVDKDSTMIWQGAPKRWHPWKIASADIDSDGNPDLLVGVYKPSKKKPFPHHSIFVYNLRKRSVTKKWLGSSLGLEFDDFIIAPASGNELPKLILNEMQLDGKRSVGKYEWMGFGFKKLCQSSKFGELKLIGVRNGLVEFIGDGKTRTY